MPSRKSAMQLLQLCLHFPKLKALLHACLSNTAGPFLSRCSRGSGRRQHQLRVHPGGASWGAVRQAGAALCARRGRVVAADAGALLGMARPCGAHVASTHHGRAVEPRRASPALPAWLRCPPPPPPNSASLRHLVFPHLCVFVCTYTGPSAHRGGGPSRRGDALPAACARALQLRRAHVCHRHAGKSVRRCWACVCVAWVGVPAAAYILPPLPPASSAPLTPPSMCSTWRCPTSSCARA